MANKTLLNGGSVGLYKRGTTWWIDVTTPSGGRIRRSAETSDKQAAKEYHDRIKAESWRTEKLGEKPQRSWDEAALRFLKETEGKASLKEYKRHLSFWTTYFRGNGLNAITRERAAQLVEQQAKTPATRNRYIASLRALLRKAAGEWDWLEKAPKLRTYNEPKHRVRWLRSEEAIQLLAALPDWLANMARLTLATGLRQSNVLHLSWQEVDLQRKVAWIYPDQANARKAIGIPLNEDAMDVLAQQRGKHHIRVFLDAQGEPMDLWTTTAQLKWKGACKQAGLVDLRWHDLRHTWASWHIQRGTPLLTLKELGGWETLEMVQRYAHLAPDHLKSYADNALSVVLMSQVRHNTKVEQPINAYLST